MDASQQAAVEPGDLVEDLVREHPSSVGFLRLKGLVCIQCGEPVWGTLAELISSKGLEVAPLVQELNQFLARGEG